MYLLSQMIHNQEVNRDLQDRGIQFIMDTDGTQFIPWEKIGKNDVIIIPAFGTTLEIMHLLHDKGVELHTYNTTCPFVEKVWNRAEKLGKANFTVIIHGKPKHEETRATFSHSSASGPSVIVRNMEEAVNLAAYIKRTKRKEDFYEEFAWRYSEGFDPERDLSRIGVVNQTTMLASETQAIADYFRSVMISVYGEDALRDHFADTRDTLCYATNDNQDSTYALLDTDADLAIVVGGYNSSNTSHLADLCARKFPTYFINAETEIYSASEIHHFRYATKEKLVSYNFLPDKNPVTIVLTSGASCPDTLVDRVMFRLLEFYTNRQSVEDVLRQVGIPA